MLRDVVKLSRTAFSSRLLFIRVFDTGGVKNYSQTLADQGIKTGCRQNIWDPLNLLNCPPSYKHALIILNRPINWRHDLFMNIWDKASVRVTVDGGTDQWIKFLGTRGEATLSGENVALIPDLITGDMDSICSETLLRLRRLGANVVETPDQDATDYTKALIQLGAYAKSREINLDGIYVFAETSGRLDHIIANINTLYIRDKLGDDVQIIQVSGDSLTWLLRPGSHKIFIAKALINKNAWCALMPIGCRVNGITTTGLRWNLENAVLEFGGMVSTSNTYNGSPEVTITTDTPVLWSMEIEPLMVDRSESL